MSGVTVTTRLDTGEVRASFARLSAAVADTTPIMRAIGTALVTSTQDRFVAQKSPEGAGWQALNPKYKKDKRGPGILRESGMRGGLQGSITYDAGRSDVRIGTNKIYGAIHQFGGVIFAKNPSGLLFFRMGGEDYATPFVVIPARPYLGISDDDTETIGDVVEGALARALGSGSSSGGRRR